MGGDEFTVLLPEVSDTSSAELVATKIMAAMKKPFRVSGQELQVTTSIGVSLHPQHGEDVATLMRHADIAMYRVKARGRAGYAVFDSAMLEGKP
jgi:diguanylate cyclase (GGDEF)-like protein